jgi:hypothetical protein
MSLVNDDTLPGFTEQRWGSRLGLSSALSNGHLNSLQAMHML